jgi:hypothetical protein
MLWARRIFLSIRNISFFASLYPGVSWIFRRNGQAMEGKFQA